MRFVDDVGPCSGCGNHINIQMEGDPATETKAFCPQCFGGYVKKERLKEIIEEQNIDGIIYTDKIKKQFGFK